jgi:hypothetical protein
MFVRKTNVYWFFDVSTNVSLGDFNKPLAAEAWHGFHLRHSLLSERRCLPR